LITIYNIIVIDANFTTFAPTDWGH